MNEMVGVGLGWEWRKSTIEYDLESKGRNSTIILNSL